MTKIDEMTLRELVHEVRLFDKTKSYVNNKLFDIRIAITGNYSTQFLAKSIPLGLSQKNISADVYESPYNLWKYDLINPQSNLYQFSPTHIVLFLTSIELAFSSKFPAETIALNISDIISKVLANCNAQIIFVMPEPLSDEVFDSSWAFTWRKIIINKLKEAIVSDRVSLVDIEPLIRRIGSKNWYSERFYDSSKLAFHPDRTGQFLNFIVDVIAGLLQPQCKLIIVDLDDTLWGGRVGDDTWEGIGLDSLEEGRHFLRMQLFLKSLRDSGAILAIASKNDYEPVKKAFQNRQEMILNINDFAAHEINWGLKSESIGRILDKLNLSTQGVVFIDDNPAEREEVRARFPDIYIPDLPDNPADRVPMLMMSGLFEIRKVTEESKKRNDFYNENKDREELLSKTSNIHEFLLNLEMSAEAVPADLHVNRVVELLYKTNQFNLTGRRYHWSDLEKLSKSGFIRCYRLKDKFGDNGIVSVIFVRLSGSNIATIDTWVMSCRVFGRTLEQVILSDIICFCRASGVKSIIGEFIKSDKNNYVDGLYERLGFKMVEEQSNVKTKIYSLSLEEKIKDTANQYITLCRSEY